MALVRFLCSRGAKVILNDKRPAEQMKSEKQMLSGLQVEWVLGEHPLSLLSRVDMVCLSGGVPLTLPIVVEAQKRSLPISNDSQIFMEAVQAPVIAITGSAGKTTTTTLVGRMARAAAQENRRVWVGGNIGLPLVEFVDDIKPEDIVILELSSFQLEQMTRSPHIAAVLNITPNHLDRHGTMQAYTEAKARILAFQNKKDIAILNREDKGSWQLRNSLRGKLISFGLKQPPSGETGMYMEGGYVKLQENDQIYMVLPEESIQLRGEHNLLTVLAACAISSAAGFPFEAMAKGVEEFLGVEHRLEVVRTYNGVTWINECIATAPERTMAAIRSFSEPLVLLLGGRDKNLPWNSLAEMIHNRVEHVIVYGEAAEKISAAIGAIREGDRLVDVQKTTNFEGALNLAVKAAKENYTVLLSPGCTSYDAFRDFEELGTFYKKWVNALS
ncbi:MAG: UDP-N-acetylmuramoyl-L-alanine--D-glutamate ligase [Chloroflexi bacterium HGW-Chloroflexi-7]|nr:MAG: UDP-N-acetylmuramoyl-L-alanine--D-glutamate ligase [Chloroflexi bacterium HGW-Chloroflexi-7]